MTTTLPPSTETLETRYLTCGINDAEERTSNWDDGAVYTPKFLTLVWQSRDDGPWTLEDVCLSEVEGECVGWGAGVEALPWVAEAIGALKPRDKAPE